MVQPGALLAGKYRVDRVLGQGGMGVVVQAMHLQLGQPVAVKFLLPEILHNAEIVHRFLREAQAAVRLRSEHVARVIDVGTLESGAPFMVLEYLDGADLSHHGRGQLSTGVVVDLMLQACEALAEAHSLGIVHRDIKPANFFVTRRPDGSLLLKVLDFGISKTTSATDGNLTATQSVMGTPAYMAPEQMRSSKNVDARADIWAIGAVLYELFQGVQPFQAESFASMCLKVAMDPLGALTTPLPPGLAEVVYRCLEKDPARRYPSVAELAVALAPYAGNPGQASISVERVAGVLGVTSTSRALHATRAPAGSPTTLSGAATSSHGARPPHARRWPLVAAIGAVVVAGAVATLVILGGRGETDAPTPAAAGLPSAPVPAATAPATTPVPAATPVDAGTPVAITPDAAPPTSAEPATVPPTETVAPPSDRSRSGTRRKPRTRPTSGSGNEDLLDSRN